VEFYKKLVLSLSLCVGGGWLCGIVTRQGIADWYSHLNQPPGTPPNIVFPIVWTILYTLMGIALALLWSSNSSNKQLSFGLFALQLILNFNWSWIFFGLKNSGLALIDLMLLWVAVCGTIFALKKHTALGAWLLLPYLIWTTYALYLNLFVWILN